MKSNTFTPAYVRQYLYAGVLSIIGFILSLSGGVWFMASAGRAGALVAGTAPMWVHTVIALISMLLFASLWLATKAFEKAKKETLSLSVFIGGMIILLAVGQLWHFAM